MATYNTAFGSLPGYNEMLGTTNTTGGGQQQVYGQRAQQQRQGQAAPAPAQTFAQLQQRGMARPAPVQGPQAQPFAQYGGSQQAAQMRQRLQEQLAAFGNQPSRYDTQAFQQIRGAQAANLQAEYQGQQKALNEELARRGLSASSVGGGRMGDLAGQQARALASLDAQMLQQAAETQAADRAQLLQAGQGLAELAGSQDLAQFEANRVAQAATFENQLRAAQFGQQQYEQAGQEELERAQLTGMLGEQQTLAGQQFGEQQRQFNVEQGLRQVLGLGGLSLQERQQLQQQAEALTQATGRVYRVNGAGRIEEAIGTAGQTLAGQQQQLAARQAAFQQAAQLSQSSGNQYTVDESGAVVPVTGPDGKPVATSDISQANLARQQQQEQFNIQQFGATGAPKQGAQTLSALQQQTQQTQALYQQASALSEQSGIQHTVVNGAVTQLRNPDGSLVRTSAFSQAEEQRKQQDTLTRLDLNLRRQLGLTEATGQMYNIDPFTGMATAASGGAQTVEAQRLALQQAGVTGTFQGALTQEALQNAYARAAQLSQITGQQYTVNPANGQITAAGDTLAARLQQAGITGTFGGALTQDALQNAYARAAQLQQATGKQYTVNPATGAITEGGTETLAAQLQKAQLTGTLSGASTLEKLQQNLQQAQVLSQITGKQYTVDSNGDLVPGGGDVTEAARQFNLEQTLRQQLGLTEASGYIYDMNQQGLLSRTQNETVQGQLARSQLLMSLMNTLKDLDPTQIANLLGQSTTTSGGTTTTQGGTTQSVTTTQSGTSDWSSSLGPTSWGAGTMNEKRIWGGKIWQFNGNSWADTSAGSTNTTTTGGSTTTTSGTTTTTPRATTTTAGGTISTSSLSSQITSILSGYKSPFSGMYAEVGDSTGNYWAVYQNGTWGRAASAPTITQGLSPDGTYAMPVYPGAQQTGADGKLYRWTGSSWVAI